MPYKLDINGRMHDVDTPRGTSLLSVLRDDLLLTGTRFGCGHGKCGACHVLVDGRATPSCLLGVDECVDRRIITIEGLASGGRLHPVQAAFAEADAMQCGYCTSGMVISAVGLLERRPRPSDAEIREALSQNLCRCGVYGRAIAAVHCAAERCAAQDAASDAPIERGES